MFSESTICLMTLNAKLGTLDLYLVSNGVGDYTYVINLLNEDDMRTQLPGTIDHGPATSPLMVADCLRTIG